MTRAPLRLAVTRRQRLRGMLGRTKGDDVWLLAPCCDIHTLGMDCDIDVAFLDGSGTVLEVSTALSPGHRMRVPEAAAVLERRSTANPWYRQGDRIALGVMKREE